MDLETGPPQGPPGMEFDPWFQDTDGAGHAGSDDGASAASGMAATTSFFEKNKAIHLAWENLEYTVGVKASKHARAAKSNATAPVDDAKDQEPPTDRKVIIQGVSGEVRPGEILAIMGGSGAGKTTLLNLLAGRLAASRNFETGGRILVNGVKRDPHLFKKMSAYVEQDDKMFAELTVEEQIMFSAALRLPQSMSMEDKQKKVDETIVELGLSKCRASYIGSELIRGVSGGERKRVNVGTELVADPALLFLDEPTSGLDSFNALNVMHTLRKLASAGRTVVTTIHQPRSNIFDLFDKLLLLSEGRVMYFGPAGEALAYFAQHHFHSPPQFNPADYFIDLTSPDPRNRDLEARSKGRIHMLGDAHIACPAELEGLNFSDEEVADAEARMAEVAADVKYETNYLQENRWLFNRTFKLMLREKAGNISRVVEAVFLGLVLGVIWLNVGRDFDKNDLSNSTFNANASALVGILFFVSVNEGFTGVFNVVFTYPLERAIVLRERAPASYRVSSYLISRTLSDLVRNFLTTLVFSLISYWMVGLQANVQAFFTYLLVLMLVVAIAEGLTLCVATFTPNPQTSSAITPIFIIMAMLFGGFLISAEQMPAAVRWLRWISFVYYAVTALVHNEFEDSPGFSRVKELVGVETTKTVSILALVGMAVLLRLLVYVILRVRGPKFSKTL